LITYKIEKIQVVGREEGKISLTEFYTQTRNMKKLNAAEVVIFANKNSEITMTLWTAMNRTPKIALAHNQYTGQETHFSGVKECVDKVQDILIKG